MKEKHKSPFNHDYPDAPGVTRGGESGQGPWKHPYPATETKSDQQGAPGHTPWMHAYPKAAQPSGAHRKRSLRHFMKKKHKEGY